MTCALYLYDVAEFHPTQDGRYQAFLQGLYQSMVLDYVMYGVRSGNPYQIHPPALEGYVATLMEHQPGFDAFPEALLDDILRDAVSFLRNLIDRVEVLTHTYCRPVWVYPVNETSRCIALVV